MATFHHHSTTTTTSYHPRYRHSLDYSSLPSSTSLSTLKHSSKLPTFSISTSASASASVSTTTTTTTTTTENNSPYSLETLEKYLTESNFREADKETRRLLIVLAGEPAIKRGYVFFSEVQFIPKEELKAMDNLWLKYSSGRFGYSVQKKIWVKVDKDFTKFFIKLGWMKKLDTEIEQFNYRAFPNEFIWELNQNNSNGDVPPEGHLPLTNALRGTQLLTMIFSHPAFDTGDDEEKRNEENNNDIDSNNGNEIEEVVKKKSKLESLRDRLFKPNYSF